MMNDIKLFKSISREETLEYIRQNNNIITNIDNRYLSSRALLYLATGNQKATKDGIIFIGNNCIDGLILNNGKNNLELLLECIQSGNKVINIHPDISKELLKMDYKVKSSVTRVMWAQYYMYGDKFSNLDTSEMKNYRRAVRKYSDNSLYDTIYYPNLEGCLEYNEIINLWDAWAEKQAGRKNFSKSKVRDMILNIPKAIKEAHLTNILLTVVKNKSGDILAYSISELVNGKILYTIEAKYSYKFNLNDINKYTLYAEWEYWKDKANIEYINIGCGDQHYGSKADEKTLLDKDNPYNEEPLNMSKRNMRPDLAFFLDQYNTTRIYKKDLNKGLFDL